MRRHLSSAAVLMFCAILAGGSEDETADAKRDRLAKENNISTMEYDSAVKDYGSFQNYQEAKKLGLGPVQYQARQAQEANCRQDWKKCADNSQLVNTYANLSEAKVGCQDSANRAAKYGDPKWGWITFGTFYKGTNYVKTGRITLIDNNVQFSNGFGAPVNSEVVCNYDLNTNRVTGIDVHER